jgi:hypothetical protein
VLFAGNRTFTDPGYYISQRFLIKSGSIPFTDILEYKDAGFKFAAKYKVVERSAPESNPPLLAANICARSEAGRLLIGGSTSFRPSGSPTGDKEGKGRRPSGTLAQRHGNTYLRGANTPGTVRDSSLTVCLLDDGSIHSWQCPSSLAGWHGIFAALVLNKQAVDHIYMVDQ